MMLQEFIEQLKNDMDDIQADYGTATNAEKFAVWVGWKLFGLDPRQIVDDLLLLVDELGGVAVFSYFENDSDKVNIISCWHRGNGDRSQVGVKRVESLKDLWPGIKGGELPTTSAAGDFFLELNDRGLSVDFTNYIVTDAEFSQAAYDFAQEQSLQLIDLNQLRDAYIRMQHPLRIEEPSKLKFIISDLQAFEGPQIIVKGSGKGVIPTLVCALPLSLIYDWVSRFGNGLFAENLRLRLSEYDKNALALEQSVQETILATPELMFVQNNGITITCAEIEPKLDRLNEGAAEASEVHVTLHNPQIVNGCQTSWAIHNTVERMRSNNEQPPSGFVLAKIVQTQDSNLAQEITSASNRQNAIQPRDQRVKDKRQIYVSMGLAEHAPNLGIYWDYRRGGWSNILSKEEETRYRIKGKGNSYRELNNGLAGQVFLAMAGAVHEAKNKGGRIFDSDRLYKVAFGYDLQPQERFADLASPLLNSGGDNALSTYLDDLLFGFAIFQHATAAFKWLYADRDRMLKKKLDQTNSDQRRPELENAIELISSREFVKYWVFDVVRLVHLIVEEWVRLGEGRQDVRRNLVGDLTQAKYLDPLFLSKAKRAKWFNMESNLSMANTLHRMKPSDELPRLGIWFKSLEQLGAEVVERIMRQEPTVSPYTLVLKRPSTHLELAERLMIELKKASFPQLFPPA
jgi:hypothetical protein